MQQIGNDTKSENKNVINKKKYSSHLPIFTLQMTLTHRIDNTHGVMFTTQVPVDVLRRSLGTGSLMLLTLILLTLSAKKFVPVT